MPWRLKDKELQRKLDEVSDGDFSKCLANISHAVGDSIYIVFGKRSDRGFFRNPGDYRNFQMCISYDELEYIPEYNPKRWNKYPDVTPPYGVMMRLKMKSGILRAGYLKKFSEGGFWCNSNHIRMSRAENLDVDMFKPWDD